MEWTPPPAASLLGLLHDAIRDRQGWWPAGVVGEHTVTAEYRPVPGEPGGAVTGCSSHWRWTADDGLGTPLGALAGPLPSPHAARDALEAAVRAHLRTP